MRARDYGKLLADVEQEVLDHGSRIAILGLTDVTTRLLRDLNSANLLPSLCGVYALKPQLVFGDRVAVHSFEQLADDHIDALVIAADDDKEVILRQALPFISGTPKIIVSGYGHFKFVDADFDQIVAEQLVPSIANGYPNCLIHIYQCLQNAARLKLNGLVVEFGTFKGGTASFMADTVSRLGCDWRVLTFDTFDGFPPRRSPLDMYEHADCVFTNSEAVRRLFDGRNIELVSGDIVETAARLKSEDIVLSFVDTDNYTSAMAALDVIRDQTVIGGAIVFDHLTGTDRFRYTLGERFAAQTLLNDTRYFNLHGTGVFLRQN